MRPTYYEFFAGGGMARAGLGAGWECRFANDFDPKKAAAYEANWGGDHFRLGDVAALTTADLPGHADLAWASFPCQDLSLAGAGKGLGGERSGTFWAFWRLMRDLRLEGRGPRVIALENVVGLLTSRGGVDFHDVVEGLVSIGYRVGAMVIDAERFVPQSRPRVFFVAVRNDLSLPASLVGQSPPIWCSPSALSRAVSALRHHLARSWVWWRLPEPPVRQLSFADVIDEEPDGVQWHTEAETARLLGMMTEINLAKVEAAREAGGRMVGGVYRRTRPTSDGGKRQRAEVRFDISGCLRTPAGGSSRQTVLIAEDGRIKSRLLSPREAARLMGLDSNYQLPPHYNDAYHLLGDGVAAPVVGFLTEHLFRAISSSNLDLIAAE